MATITKTYTENISSGSARSKWTVVYACPNVTVTDSTFSIAPTIEAKYDYSGAAIKSTGRVDITIKNNADNTTYRFARPTSGTTSMTNGTQYSIPLQTPLTLTTSTFFSSSNPTVKTITFPFVISSLTVSSGEIGNKNFGAYNPSGTLALGDLCTVTLNAPPTFMATSVQAGQPYIGAFTYTLNVSSLSAKYGGTISSVELTIGSQSVSRTTNGSLTIQPDTAGTFTPTVTVTDSRGQKTTKTFSAITVNANTASISSLSARRVDDTGKADDEGTYACIAMETNYTAFSGNYLNKPEVTIGGLNKTNSITWYTSWTATGGFANPVTWTNYAPTSPVTLYGYLSDTYSHTLSYAISATPSTTTVTGSAKTATLAQAFFLLAGREGGKGLGIGMKPAGDALYIGMTTNALDNIVLSVNNKYLRGRYTDDVIRSLIGVDASNNLLVGYGGYDGSVGGTRVYGHTMSLHSHGGITIYTDTDGTEKTSSFNSTGTLTLAAAPTSDMHAVTKKYTDDTFVSKTSVKDYIIATGSSGNWYYRKWNSGTLECWGRKQYTGVNVNGTAGQLKYKALDSIGSYPVAFISYPTVTITGTVTGGNGWVVGNNTNYSQTWCGGLYVYAPFELTSVGVTANVYAIGRWK